MSDLMTVKQGGLWGLVIVFGGLAYLLGGAIEGRKMQKAALRWAALEVSRCESSETERQYPTVVDCLELAIERAEEDRREWEYEEGQAAKQQH